MSLLTPLGLIALIGIPIIIIIYILKPKYREKTINSTYIWKLSLKYRKRKLPLQWLKNSLLLLTQLLIVTVLAFMITQPFIKHPKAQYERIIILDASASMMAVDAEGKTRFEKAKEEILSEAEQSSQEYDMSIILCDDEPEWIVQNAFGKGGNDGDSAADAKDQKALGVNRINIELSKAACSYGVADYAKAVALADEYRRTHPDAKVLLYTDHDFSEEGHVSVRNFAGKNEWNASIVSAKEMAGGNDTLYFDVGVGSFGKTGSYVLVADITGINGYSADMAQSKLHIETPLTFTSDEVQSITVRGERDQAMPDGSVEDMRIYSYDTAKFSLVTSTGAAVNDSFAEDDTYYCYGLAATNFTARVETDDNSEKSYVMTALSSVGNVDCTEVSQRAKDLYEKSGATYNAPTANGFDLYVYEGQMPYSLPTDGAIWLINVPTNWGVSQAFGVTVGNPVTVQSGAQISVNTAEESGLYKGLTGLSQYMHAWRYRPLTIAEDNQFSFKTILTVNGEPVMVAGENAQGVKMVVLSVDLSYTDLPLIVLPVIADNVCNYTLSYPVDPLAYTVGESVSVYSKPLVTDVTVKAEGQDKPLYEFNKASGEFPVNFAAKLPGVYVVEQEFSNTSEIRSTRLFVGVAPKECNIVATGGILSEKDGTETANDALTDSDLFDIEDITFWFALGLLVLLFVEWGLQSREQY